MTRKRQPNSGKPSRSKTTKLPPPDASLKARTSSRTGISVGNISDVGGDVNIAGRDINTQHSTGLSVQEVGPLFEQIYSAIQSRPETSAADTKDLEAAVQEIQSTVSAAAQKNEKVDEGFLAGRFRNIARIAPDVLDVVVTTLANPLAGLGVAAKKIAEKAKEETGGKS